MFNVAVEWGMLETSPAAKLKQLPESKPRDIFLSAEELRAIIHACDADENIFAAALFKLAMFTGRRIGELKALKWDQVDLDEGVLIIPETKAGELQRAYLNEQAIEVLASLPRVEGNPHVIVGRLTGQPLNAYRKSWDRILNRAGLQPFPPHGLRHSFASQLVVSGTPLETVRSIPTQYKQIQPWLPRGRRGARRVDDRRVISGIIHMLRTGARWRDCPSDYGPYTTIYNRFNRWSKQGVWEDVFYQLTGSSGVIGAASVDSTHIKAHRSASGAKGGTTPRPSDDRAADGRLRFMR